MRMSKELSHYNTFITIDNLIVVPTPVFQTCWTAHWHVTKDVDLKYRIVKGFSCEMGVVSFLAGKIEIHALGLR